MQRPHFRFRSEWLHAISLITDPAAKAELAMAIIDYGINGTPPAADANETVRVVMALVMPQIDAQTRRRALAAPSATEAAATAPAPVDPTADKDDDDEEDPPHTDSELPPPTKAGKKLLREYFSVDRIIDNVELIRRLNIDKLTLKQLAADCVADWDAAGRPIDTTPECIEELTQAIRAMNRAYSNACACVGSGEREQFWQRVLRQARIINRRAAADGTRSIDAQTAGEFYKNWAETVNYTNTMRWQTVEGWNLADEMLKWISRPYNH